MAMGVVLAQVVPYEDESFLEVLVDAYVPQVAAMLIVLVVAVVVVKVLPKRQGSDAKPERARPDWYPDPWGEPYERWWNGESWTAAVRAYPWPGPSGPPGGGGPYGPGAGSPGAPPAP